MYIYIYIWVTSALQSGRIGADEEIDDFKGRSAEEVEEIKAEKEAKTQAILLEMVKWFLCSNSCSAVCSIHTHCEFIPDFLIVLKY